jgi:predicted Zn-dependent peptidase
MRLAPLLVASACAHAAAPFPKPIAAAPATAAASAPSSAPAPAPGLTIPIEQMTLPSGLRVVVSPNHTVPVVAVGVYYRVGFRIEPQGRTGFAHLFEHMMFQGSQNLGKMELGRLIQSNGGIFNGSTRFDFTSYYEVAPTNALETILWAEADRMRGLAVTDENLKNQKEVVANEVRVNVINAPYGAFPWLLMPQVANENWHNAHNFYGDLADIEAAKLDEVQAFFATYYVPANAVLVLVGDVQPGVAFALATKYFGTIPSPPPPAPVDVSEPRQEKEKRRTVTDALATRPALAIGYHMPPRGTPEAHAMLIIQKILAEGADSLLHQALVQRRGLTGEISSAINLLGNAWDYAGPMTLDIWMFHDQGTKPDELLGAIDAEVERLRTVPVDQATLARAQVKARAAFYDTLSEQAGLGKLDLLASFALFDDDPTRVNGLDAALRQVTPELVLATAREYLRPGNRTVLVLEVKP